jgi:hypothetical protein
MIGKGFSGSRYPFGLADHCVATMDRVGISTNTPLQLLVGISPLSVQALGIMQSAYPKRFFHTHILTAVVYLGI